MKIENIKWCNKIAAAEMCSKLVSAGPIGFKRRGGGVVLIIAKMPIYVIFLEHEVKIYLLKLTVYCLSEKNYKCVAPHNKMLGHLNS